MFRVFYTLPLSFFLFRGAFGAEMPSPFSSDQAQSLERTCFQTSQPWSANGNLRSDVAIVYGIGHGLAQRMQTWRDHGTAFTL